MVAERLHLPRVCIVSPALAAANNGNWHTASRWQRFLAPVAAVEVRGVAAEGDSDADLLIALHAGRSAAPIAHWRERRPDAPIALVLTGTDLYRDLALDSLARHSMQCASVIVVLQEAGLGRLDVASRARARVIVQSATALIAARRAGDADFVAVGHLRDVKDPETLMRAARLLRADSGASPTIAHIGEALDPSLADAARATMAECAAYRWLGAMPHTAARRAIARARALVHMSRIDGNVGLLGAGYDGYFAVGDAGALAALMHRFVADTAFAAHLGAQCAAREPLFGPAVERRAVRSLVADLLAPRSSRR